MSDTAKQVVGLLKAINDAKTRVASVNGDIGERIKRAVDNGKICSKALKHIADEIRMSEDARNDYVRSLNLYRIIAEEAGLFGDVYEGDIVDQAEAGNVEDHDAEAAARNSAAITAGIKKLKGLAKGMPKGDSAETLDAAE